MIDRRSLLVGVLAAPSAVAQSAAPPARIGVLVHSANLQAYEQLRGALRELGWVEGSTLLVEKRIVGDSAEGGRELAAELQRACGSR